MAWCRRFVALATGSRPIDVALVQLGLLLVFAASGHGLGLIVGDSAFGLAAGVFGFAGLNIAQCARFEAWLREGKQKALPGVPGHWRVLYQHVLEIRQQSRKRKRKLAQHLKRFHQSTEALPDGVVIVDQEGRVEWLNGAATQVLGVRTPVDLGRPIAACLDLPEFQEYFGTEPSGEPVELTSPLDPERVLSLRSVAFGKSQRLIIARDITRLCHLVRMRTDFVANASHEMRTPLTVLLGYLEAIQDKGDQVPDRWRQSIDSMLQHGKRLERVVEDLLLLSRIETVEGEMAARDGHAVSVPDLLVAIEHEGRSLSDGRHRITLECDDLLDVVGDAESLRSAFANLVHNAIRYTPKDGQIELRWYQDQQGAHFAVRDTGIGIPAEHIPRITERFYRVDVGRSREQGGTGLGLAIVKHALQNHGAHLDIQSEPGEGSTFRCDFPPQRVVDRNGLSLPAAMAGD